MKILRCLRPKKSKNSGETAASSKKTKATGVKQTISAATKKTKAAVEEEKTNAAAAKKNKSAATKKTKASATAGEKGTKKPEKPEKLKNPKLCVALCLPGPKSGCCQRTGKRLPGQLKCVEVYKLLEDLGVEDCSKVSQCMMAGIMAGHIKLPEGGDLDTVLYDMKGDECDHQFKITLRKLLYQPDYAGLDYEDGLENATVFCESHGYGEDECDVGRTYVTDLCQGKPQLDCGKFHNHCNGCPGFGKCLYDYRNACRINPRTGGHYKPRFVGSGGWLASDNEGSDNEGRQECSIA